MAATRHAAPQRRGVPADRQRRARRVAYLGCAADLGYGALKALWSLGGTVGLRDPERFRVAPADVTGVARLFDYWGTPGLAGLAVVILLGLVYPLGQRADRAAPAAGPGLGRVAGGRGRRVRLILMIRYFAGDLSSDRLGAIHPATFMFVYVCFLVLGVAFGMTAWLTRR